MQCDYCLTWIDDNHSGRYESAMPGTREQIHLPSGHSFRVLRWSRSVREVESLLGPGRAVRIAGEGAHWHYHVEMELTWFARGAGTRFVGDHIAPFADGDVVLLGENLPHYWHARGPSSGLSVQWSFPHGHAFWAFPESLALADLFREAGRGLQFSGATAAAVAGDLRGLAETGGAERFGLLISLLARLARVPAAGRRHLSGRSFSLPRTTVHQQAIGEAVRYLLANFRDEIRLPDVLRLTRMSKPTFSRQFKQQVGKTYSQFVAQVRLQAVCRELVETERPILEIALSCGFGQLSFFNRLFRRVYGCSPREYRVRQAGRRQARRRA
jgi:AraC-like DNA-binding protein